MSYVYKSLKIPKGQDEEMLRFFEDKGFTNGVRFLYDFYKDTSDIKDYIDKKLSNIGSVAVEPKNTVKKQVKDVSGVGNKLWDAL